MCETHQGPGMSASAAHSRASQTQLRSRTTQSCLRALYLLMPRPPLSLVRPPPPPPTHYGSGITGLLIEWIKLAQR